MKTLMKNLSKNAIARMIDFHILCVKSAEQKGFAIDHCRVVAWLSEAWSLDEPSRTYSSYLTHCNAAGISRCKNFDEEALREALQAGATQFMDSSITDPLAGE